MIKKHWWNDNRQSKTTVLGRKAARYHFVHHKYDINRPGIEPGSSKITGLRPTARAMARQLKTQLTVHYINFQVVPHRERTPYPLKRPVG